MISVILYKTQAFTHFFRFFFFLKTTTLPKLIIISRTVCFTAITRFSRINLNVRCYFMWFSGKLIATQMITLYMADI